MLRNAIILLNTRNNPEICVTIYSHSIMLNLLDSGNCVMGNRVLLYSNAEEILHSIYEKICQIVRDCFGSLMYSHWVVGQYCTDVCKSGSSLVSGACI